MKKKDRFYEVTKLSKIFYCKKMVSYLHIFCLWRVLYSHRSFFFISYFYILTLHLNFVQTKLLWSYLSNEHFNYIFIDLDFCTLIDLKDCNNFQKFKKLRKTALWLNITSNTNDAPTKLQSNLVKEVGGNR